MNQENTINELYQKYKHYRQHLYKAQMMYLIIELKHTCNLNNYKNPLYVDIKRFIYFYLSKNRFFDYGYDLYEKSKITKCLSYVNPKERITLYAFVKQTLQKQNEDADWVNNEICIAKQEFYKHNHNVIMWGLFFFSKSTHNMIFAVFVMYLLLFIIMLPAPCNDYAIFQIEYQDVSNIFFINHLINTLSIFGGLDIGYKITYLTPWAVILYGISKLIFIAIVIDFVYNKIKQEFSLW